MRLFQWLSYKEGTLKERVMRGGIWLLVGNASRRAAGLLKLVLLGRLLSPTDFGLMGIATLMLKWLTYFTKTGFDSALVQKKEDIRPYLDMTFTVQVLRNLSLAVIVFSAAPLVRSFFDSPESTPIVRAMALVLLFRGFTNPAVVYFRKELRFQRQVLWMWSGVSVGLLVAIPLAYIYRNVWALVLSAIAAQLANTLASYVIEPYRPRFQLEWAKARELMVYGKWIFWLNVVNFLSLYADSVTVGKLLGPTALGFYQMAQNLAFFPLMGLGEPAHEVAFPAFAKLQDKQNLRSAFLRVFTLIISLLVPIACFLTVFAAPLVRLTLGMQWVAISPVVQIMVWAGVLRALSIIAHALFKAVGKPHLAFRTSVLSLLMLFGLLFPLVTALGITGAAWALTVSTSVGVIYRLILVSRLLQLKGTEMVATFKIGVLGSAPFLIAGVISSPSPSPSLFAIAGLATVVYLFILVWGLGSQFRLQTGLSS